MPSVVAAADGAEGCSVQLLDDGRVIITRGGFFARQRQGALVEVSVTELTDVVLSAPRLGLRGSFEVVRRGEQARAGFAGNNTNPYAVYFTSDQHAGFEQLRRTILDRLGPPVPQGPTWSQERPVILVLTARPVQNGIQDLNVDLEEREIVEELQRVPFGDRIDLRLRPAAAVDNLLNDLLENRPSVLHFSGHGLVEGIIIEGPERTARIANEKALVRMCQLPEIQSGLRLLVLNACLTGVQASALAQSVPAVIGTLDSVQDAAAIAFARGLYNSLGRGMSIGSAFAAGVASVSIAAGEGEAQKYVIYRRSDVDLSTYALVGSRKHHNDL